MCKFIANFFILGYIFVVIHFTTVRITLDHLAVTKKESDEKDAVIKKLESQNKLLISTLEQIKELIAATLKE